MADQNHPSADLFLVGSESTAKFGTDPERGEKVPRDNHAIELHRTIEAVQSKRIVVIGN